MKRNMVASLLAITLCFGCTAPASAAELSFSDVSTTHWAVDYIQTAARNGWVNGIGGDRFAPETQVTGSDFIAMLTRMLYPDEVATTGSTGAWYAPYQTVANNHHLLSDQNLNLNSKMTLPLNRQEMSFILARAAEDRSLTVEVKKIYAAQETIPDLGSIPAAYQYSVGLAYELGLLSGVDGSGTFAGTQYMTRSQAAAVLCRLYTVLSGEEALPNTPEQGDSGVSASGTGTNTEVKIGQVVVEPYFGGYSIHYVPSSGIWTGEREDRAFGFQVESMDDMKAALASVMDRYPKSLTFFSERELDFDASALCEPYELSHGLYSRVKGACYDYYDAVPKSLDNPYKSAAGDYYEYRLDLHYGAAGIVRMYNEGIIDTLPDRADILASDTTADYTPLLNATQEIKAQYGITDVSSGYDKVYAIYQYVTSNIRYDYYMASLDGMDLSNYLQSVPYPWEINFALTNKKGTCFDYALLFQALCCTLDINCYYVDGSAGGDLHAWNIVEVDGAYYQADTTWDAGKQPDQYRYFLVSDQTLGRDHRPSESPIYNLPSCPNDYQ